MHSLVSSQLWVTSCEIDNFFFLDLDFVRNWVLEGEFGLNENSNPSHCNHIHPWDETRANASWAIIVFLWWLYSCLHIFNYPFPYRFLSNFRKYFHLNATRVGNRVRLCCYHGVVLFRRSLPHPFMFQFCGPRVSYRGSSCAPGMRSESIWKPKNALKF